MSPFFSRNSYKILCYLGSDKCYFPYISDVYSFTSLSNGIGAVSYHLAESSLLKTCSDTGCREPLPLHGFYNVMAYFTEQMASSSTLSSWCFIVWLLMRIFCKAKKFVLSSYWILPFLCGSCSFLELNNRHAPILSRCTLVETYHCGYTVHGCIILESSLRLHHSLFQFYLSLFLLFWWHCFLFFLSALDKIH